MPTAVIITNPLRALQLENQRLHREQLVLRREIEALRSELAARTELRSEITPTQTVAIVTAAAPPPLTQAHAPRAVSPPLAPRSTPGPVIHLVATDRPAQGAARTIRAAPLVQSAPPASHGETETLDDATVRFMLLELD